MQAAMTLPAHDPVAQIDEAAARMAAASADMVEAIADCDERRLWRRDGATSMTSWLAGRLGVGWGTARELVRVARTVRELPAIGRTHRLGRLSWDQLQALTRFATPDSDGYWARRAPDLRPSTLWREARRHRRLRTKDEREIRRQRYLALWWDPESPVLYLAGMLPAEEGAAVATALNRRARDVVLTDAPDSPGDARMADALAELVTEAKDGQPAPSTVVLHADAGVVAGDEAAHGPWLAETESGHRLSADAVRRLACDGRIEWVLESDGRPVGIGRRGRTVPGQIARVLRHRDGGICRFPGCERKRWLNAHHLVHWADGGVTNLDNLVLLCHAHHRLLHEGGWRTSGHPARALRFHDPGGRPLRNGPREGPTGVRRVSFPQRL
jgi:hypothetical protein